MEQQAIGDRTKVNHFKALEKFDRFCAENV